MIIDFLNTAANLKRIPRQGWIDKVSLENPESVADHTYSMAVASMIISDFKKLDTGKILKMALLHDLAESRIGDFTPDQIEKEKKTRLEDDAFNQIVSTLPDFIKTQYLQIWDEYQKGTTAEAKLLHQIDRLEMALQARIYQKEQKDNSSKEKLDVFFESARNDITDPMLKELLAKIIRKEC